jgi:hypothetical protein
MKQRLLLSVIPAVATMAIATAPAAAATPEAVSENWSGYESTTSNSDGFSAVSGGWVEPSASCTSGSSDYAAFWVGLGGGSEGSDALEQIGTQADCTSSGQAYYYAWYELVPSAPVKLDLKISPGDRIYSRVSVSGDSVTLALTDQTTGQTATKTETMSDPSPDTSTAEWIAEAPSECQGGTTGDCTPLPLADFGKVAFDSAYATSDGKSQAAGNWNATAIALDSSNDSVLGSGWGGYGALGGDGPAQDTNTSDGGAEPTTFTSNGSAFDVEYEANGVDVSSDSGDGAGYGNSDPYGYSGDGYGDGGYGYSGYGYSGGYGYGGSYGYSGSYGYGGYGGDAPGITVYSY